MRRRGVVPVPPLRTARRKALREIERSFAVARSLGDAIKRLFRFLDLHPPAAFRAVLRKPC